jgi:hypothetical protein
LRFIVAAFARPFLPRQDAGMAAAGGAREVVILLDQSFSMGYSDRWERARAAAYDAVNHLAPADRGSLVLFSSVAEIAVRSAPAAERDRLTGSIADAELSSRATRYAPALRVAESILAESPLPRREAILISDFQRGGWRGEEGARLPAGATLTPVLIGGDADTPNVTVAAVSLARSTFANRERIAATAHVMNRSTTAVNGATIALEIGGRPDALIADNAFTFVVSPTQTVRVLIVDRGAESESLYVVRALSVGDMPRVETITRRPDAVSDDDVARASVVVLNDASVPAGLARRLARFVEDGGGLLAAFGPRGSWPLEIDLLPASVGSVVDRTRGSAARLGGLEYAHPVFEVFRAPRSGDFSAVLFYGYRSLTSVPSAQVLARFDGGAPALMERTIGRGRVLLWASTLDTAWSDLPLKPVFLPFVHRMIRHLARYSEPAAWVTVGHLLDVESAGTATAPEDVVVLTPSGRRMSINEEEGVDVLELEEPGFYEVRRHPGDRDVRVVAANVDPAESDLTAMDPKEVVAAVTGESSPSHESSADVLPSPDVQERMQGIWWYLLCAGVLLLGLDTLWSNRISRKSE